MIVKRITLLAAFIAVCFTFLSAQMPNLIENGDFKSLKGWKVNENLRKSGKITLLPADQGVMITNPEIDLDGSLIQEISTGGHEWFSYSMRIKAASIYDGGSMMRASAAFVSIDGKGNVLDIVTPTNINGNAWRTYSGSIHVPDNAKYFRIVLSVLDGTCSYAGVEVKKSVQPEQVVPKSKIVSGKGFSVDSYITDRPLWEIFCDDLDRDGISEIIACDVDGLVTVRNKGLPPFLSYAAGSLVFQFAASDINGDSIKEILISSVDPKISVKVIDLSGNVVLNIKKTHLGFDRIDARDMDGDGISEIAVSKNYGMQASGLAGGIILYNNKGEKLWETNEALREFHFADILPEPGVELVAGGPGVAFKVYNRDGKLAANYVFDRSRIDHFIVSDIDKDGHAEIITSCNTGGRMTIYCTNREKIAWKNVTPALSGGGSLAGMNLVVGNFDNSIPGFETVLVGTHDIFVVDATGTIISQSTAIEREDTGKGFLPKGINSTDIAIWNEENPQLYLSSSRYRHSAYYSLQFGGNDQFGDFLVPDQEKHLEDIYFALKQRQPLATSNRQKVKVFMALSESARVPEKTLREWRTMLDKLETPNLEYLVMYEASDLLGHERGEKMTTDQIAERAKLFEKVGIPFGYFCTHGGQVWLSEEAIRKTKEVAPTMFRFLYIAENLETLYSPVYKDMLAWTEKALDFCSKNNLKMIFKEKHDSWGIIPSDPEVFKVLFNPKYKDVTVPIWATNQPYQPEVQLGGMLGLKLSGLCNEFGMSSQFWNYHSWGNYPHGIRDVPASSACPSDIMGRLDLLGLALGGTWIHIEGGQPYFNDDITTGVSPQAIRHRDLAYELIRKNLIEVGQLPVNINDVAIIRSFHTAMEAGKKAGKHIAHPYYNRNTEDLRKGFIPAMTCFEAYSQDAFPWLGYSSKWNGVTSFPETPNGWIPVLPPDANILPAMIPIFTDGEKIHFQENDWKQSAEVKKEVSKLFGQGKENIPFEVPGTCLVIQKAEKTPDTYTLLMIDPGYLAPSGVETVIKAISRKISKVTDLVSGELLKYSHYTCPVKILPGAFRVINIEMKQ